jgi:serine/threonine-protein kinase
MIEELSDYKYIDFKDINVDKLIGKGNVQVFMGDYNKNKVAIKKYENNESNIFDISKELFIGTKVKSKRLMKIYGYSYNEEDIYVIMEYINSKDLFYYMLKYDGQYMNEYSMPYITKMSIIKSLLKAIRDMWNENIIHGDLKQLNLAIQKEGDNTYIKIIDYGTCEFDFRNKGIDKEYVCSTNGYISPELNDTCIISHKSDIYALGVIITEIYIGFINGHDDCKLCRNELLRELRYLKNINPDLEKIIRKCVDIKPEKRPDIYKLIKMINKLS